MENINQEKWSKLIKSDKDAFILDVRTPQECALGILPNAKVLNFMDYDLFIKGLEKGDKVFGKSCAVTSFRNVTSLFL